jgi:hypothetical protein
MAVQKSSMLSPDGEAALVTETEQGFIRSVI